jgi:tetratricopeptide (TPR) repeat protein
MKNYFLLLVLSTSITTAQWFEKTSCNKNADKITNQAIESLTNLEYSIALGMAKAALTLDPNCGCAKLVVAAVSSNNPDFGSRRAKLDAIDVSKLSAEENVWYTFLGASREDRSKVIEAGVSKHPNSPIINYLTTNGTDFNSYKAFAEKFPKNAASSYNMMSYGYLRGDFGDPNKEMAMEYVKKSQTMHDGPNAYDSMAEHYASIGEYEKALELELKAVDFAEFGSTYWNSVQLYWSKTNQNEVSENIMQKQKKMQEAILTRDYESYSAFEHPDITHSTGDSNLSPFYEFNKKAFETEAPIVWDSFDMNDMKVSFSPDMKTAVLTFYGSGSYTFKADQKEVSYSTRGSSVWVNTNKGWKIMHSSWAPNQGKNGIPQS